MRAFIAAIFLMGGLRFGLTVADMPNNTVRFFSMTAIIVCGMLYFAVATNTHKERLKAAYLLILPYMIVEVAALGYTWASGRPTIFHAPEYSFGGLPIADHTIGHLVGGLTWEPLLLAFVPMEAVWLIYKGAFGLIGGKQTGS
jgi:hypothetical protein